MKRSRRGDKREGVLREPDHRKFFAQVRHFPANYLRNRLRLPRTAFWYGAMPAPRALVIARCAWVELGVCPPSSDARNIDWQDAAALNAMLVIEAADAFTFSSTMSFISRSCFAEGRVPGAAILVVRVAMTVADPCISSIELWARSNQAPAIDFRERLMSRHQTADMGGRETVPIRPPPCGSFHRNMRGLNGTRDGSSRTCSLVSWICLKNCTERAVVGMKCTCTELSRRGCRNMA